VLRYLLSPHQNLLNYVTHPPNSVNSVNSVHPPSIPPEILQILKMESPDGASHPLQLPKNALNPETDFRQD